MNRPPSASPPLLNFLVFAPFAISVSALLFLAAHPDDENSKGIRAFKKKNYKAAALAFSRAIDEAADKSYLNGEASLNLGLTRDKAGLPVQALKAYSFVSENFSGGRKDFESLFNQGELNGRLGREEEALLKYREALEFQTDEQKIKENIEALFMSEQDKSKQSGKSDSSDQKKARSGEKQGASKKERSDGPSDGSPQQKKEEEEESKGRSQKNNSPEKEAADGEGKDRSDKSGGKDDDREGGVSGGERERDKRSGKKSRADKDNKENPGARNGDDGNEGEGASQRVAAPQPQGEEGGGRDQSGRGRSGAFEEAPARAILDSLEKQETDVRRRLYRQKTRHKRRRRPPQGKDW